MFATNIKTTPTTYGLSPCDAAVLMKKYIAILGMLNYGSPEEKRTAKSEFSKLDECINNHINNPAFEMAQRNLCLMEEDINALG